jgi:hypothetical protein
MITANDPGTVVKTPSTSTKRRATQTTGNRLLKSVGGLTPNAATFVNRLAADTGLNPAVIAGQVIAETSGYNTTNGPNNWLNVGSFDSGFVDGGSNVWNDPITAADATASFITGKTVNGVNSPVGPASSSIQGILSTVGQSAQAQADAIQSSDWASSHYGGNLYSDVQPFLRYGAKVKANAIVRPDQSGNGNDTTNDSPSSGSGSGSGSGSSVDTLFDNYETEVNTPRTMPQGFAPATSWKAPFQWWYASFMNNYNNDNSSSGSGN